MFSPVVSVGSTPIPWSSVLQNAPLYWTVILPSLSQGAPNYPASRKTASEGSPCPWPSSVSLAPVHRMTSTSPPTHAPPPRESQQPTVPRGRSDHTAGPAGGLTPCCCLGWAFGDLPSKPHNYPVGYTVLSPFYRQTHEGSEEQAPHHTLAQQGSHVGLRSMVGLAQNISDPSVSLETQRALELNPHYPLAQGHRTEAKRWV